MQLSFLKLAAAYLSVFGGASQSLANPLMEVLSITLTEHAHNYQGVVSNNPAGTGAQINALKEPDCADPRKAAPLYRGWKGAINDHLYTTDKAEFDRAVAFGYTAEGIAGYIFTDAQPGTAPLYRLWSGAASDHFYTLSAEERDRAEKDLGYAFEGVAGYVYTPASGPFCGSKPFYRLYKGPITDHFYTVSEERIKAIAGGYSDEGVVGWVLRF
ncbi:hypothetical protein MD484_g3887, partial [Candolleomyces efflorescens]